MGYILPLCAGVVVGVVLLVVTGEAFYLFYWRKRPLYPRGNSVPVAPLTEAEILTDGEAVGAGELADAAATEVIIDVQCAEYQIAALHQDLVEKLFPALGVASEECALDLLGQTRMLFTIAEETKEELEGLDLDNSNMKRTSGGDSLSKSMSDVSLSPVGPLSPLSSSTPFATPPSSPEHFLSPYGTPTYSPLLAHSFSPNPVLVKTSARVGTEHLNGSPPVGPPSPTRPTFPFLSRGSSSPSTSPDLPPSIVLEPKEWCSPRHGINKLSPNHNATAFYSPPRKPFLFAPPVIHGKQVEGVVKVTSPLRTCTYLYENGTFSPSNPSSPLCPPSPLICTLGDHLARDKQDLKKNLSPSTTPPPSSPIAVGSFFKTHSDSVPCTSPPSYRPSPQRSSSMLFPSSFPCPVLGDRSPTKSFPDTGSSSPTESNASFSSSWDSMSTRFTVDSSNSSRPSSVLSSA